MKNSQIRETIRRIALLNALSYGGKARAQSVLGKLLATHPHLKDNIEEVSSLIAETLQDVNSLSLNQQRRIVEERWPAALVKEKVEEEKRLPPLPNVDRYAEVVTRFSPNPDCVLHLGSARAIVLCYEYAHMYKGKF
ncbi:MAG: glutamate--tRNA ligase family protein, partial [Candidatus Bathyarchaeota archaeon]|nr:glutamate--tRNA ligase family protein [Candidatus Bathyarchaeota archaeon]